MTEYRLYHEHLDRPNALMSQSPSAGGDALKWDKHLKVAQDVSLLVSLLFMFWSTKPSKKSQKLSMKAAVLLGVASICSNIDLFLPDNSFEDASSDFPFTFEKISMKMEKSSSVIDMWKAFVDLLISEV